MDLTKLFAERLSKNEHKPKRAWTKKSTNQKQHKPKRARIKNSMNQIGHEPKRAWIKNSTNQIGHKPKRERTKKGTKAIFSYLNLNVSEIKKILHRNKLLPGSFNYFKAEKKFKFFLFTDLIPAIPKGRAKPPGGGWSASSKKRKKLNFLFKKERKKPYCFISEQIS